MRTLVNLGRFVWPIFHIVNVLIVSEFCESSEMPAYLVTNFKQNAEKHHLSKGIGSFDKSVYTIVARRGQEYSFTLKFKKPQTKPFQLYLNLYFLFDTSKKTSYKMPVLTKKAGSIFDWHSWGKSIDNMTYDFLLWIPVNASIGIYSLTTGIVETESNAFRHIWSLFKIYVIFNPWAPYDHVYMSLAGAADEYVLNEHGVIYIGNEKTPGKKVWNYNLFDFETVNITFWLLQKTQLTVDQLANPIYVSRMLSKIANSNDEDGILAGRWDGNYKGHTAPSKWSNSLEILKKYRETETTVRYGQCWVFAGLLASLLRVIGIPARPVTSYNSAHDVDYSLTVDHFVDANGKSKEDSRFKDSVWNFHVWTEVWFSRVDLPSPFNRAGWQVVDATPQEKSNGKFQLGPACVSAVKNGQVNFNYDTGFTFSMSNADVVYWTTFGKHLKRVRTDMTQIGTAFYTKKMGSSQTDFEDLTSNYKYAEKSEAERWAMRTAGYQMMLPFLYDDEVKLRAENETVGFRFIHSPNQIWGNNVTLTYQLFNKKSAPIKVNFTFHVDLIHYNGVSLKTLKFNRQVISLAKREIRNFTVVLENDSYLHSTQDEPAFKAVGFGTVIDREETVVEISTVTLKKPELSVKVHAKDKGSELYVAEVSLVNPILDRPLNNCRIISVLSVIKMKGKVESFSIQPAKKFTINFDFEFVSSKDKKAILQLDCENLHDVIGEAQFSDVIKKVENTEEIELARAISSKPKINSTNKAANQTETTKAARKVKNKNAKNSSPKPKMKV